MRDILFFMDGMLVLEEPTLEGIKLILKNLRYNDFSFHSLKFPFNTGDKEQEEIERYSLRTSNTEED